jgi:hypothetical protein
MVDPVGKRQLNAFYDLYDKVDKVKNTLKYLEETDPKEAVEYSKTHVPEIKAMDYVEIIHKDIQDLNAKAKLTDLSKNLTGEQKLKIISKFTYDQNLIAKNVDKIKTFLEKR